VSEEYLHSEAWSYNDCRRASGAVSQRDPGLERRPEGRRVSGGDEDEDDDRMMMMIPSARVFVQKGKVAHNPDGCAGASEIETQLQIDNGYRLRCRPGAARGSG